MQLKKVTDTAHDTYITPSGYVRCVFVKWDDVSENLKNFFC